MARPPDSGRVTESGRDSARPMRLDRFVNAGFRWRAGVNCWRKWPRHGPEPHQLAQGQLQQWQWRGLRGSGNSPSRRRRPRQQRSKWPENTLYRGRLAWLHPPRKDGHKRLLSKSASHARSTSPPKGFASRLALALTGPAMRRWHWCPVRSAFPAKQRHQVALCSVTQERGPRSQQSGSVWS
jgi:hypothetical protein